MKQLIAILMILFLAGCAAPQVVPAAQPATAVPAAPAAQTAPAAQPAAPQGQHVVVGGPSEESDLPPAMPLETAAINALPPPTGPSSPGPTGATDTVTLKQGYFHSVVHPTDGLVRIYRTPLGKNVLGLMGFTTTPGPGLTIVLHNGDPKNGLSVSTLTASSGNYPYNLPDNVDVSKYSQVSIYNKKYNVIYGTADLS